MITKLINVMITKLINVMNHLQKHPLLLDVA